MPVIVNYETGGDSDEPIGDLGGDEYDEAQSFTMPGADSLVDRVAINTRKVNSVTDAITVRIETSAAGPKPSGTLANASATTTIAPSNTTYDWVTATFPASFNLTASTKYWIVCLIGNQATNDHYDWFRDVSSGYADGGESTSVNGAAFGNESGTQDLYFRVYSPEAIIAGQPNASFFM